MLSDANPLRRMRYDRYRAFDEPVVRLRKHHPIAAVVPFVPSALILLSWVMVALGFYNFRWIMGLLTVVVAIDLLRRAPKLGGVGRLLAILFYVAIGLLLAGVIPVPDLEYPGLIVVLVALISFARAVYIFIEYFTIRIYLTDRRILRVSGLLTRRVATLPLRMLTDVGFEETWLGSIFGYGHFDVESAGQDQALSKLRYVEFPWSFYHTIMALAPQQRGAVGDEVMAPDKVTLRLARRWRISLEAPGRDRRAE